MTAAGAYVDELTLLPEEFFSQLLARLSVPGAKLFATTNPDGPAHWARKKFLLRQNTLDLRSWHFTLDDNPALDPAYVEALKNEYTGLWYRRFILGEWCLAEGAIYSMWDDTKHVVTDKTMPKIVGYLAAGIDHGATNPFHAVLVGLGVDNRLYVTSEWQWDAKIRRQDLSDVQLSERVRSWLGGIEPEYVVVDPSAKQFRVQLGRDGVDVTKGNNDVVDGIRAVGSLLSLDKLRVHESCQHLIDEIPGYSWDDVAAERGEDQPIKVDDHGLDALRYAIYTTRSLWRDVVTLAA